MTSPSPSEIAVALAKVKRKIARNKAKGIILAGTEFDPTSKLKLAKSARERRAAMTAANRFLSRKTQFVPDARSRPIPIREWRAYKKVEEATNRFRDTLYNREKNTKGPGGHMTLHDMVTVSTPSNPHLTNATNTHNPAHRYDRKSRNVASRSALKRLTEDMRFKGTDAYEAKMIASSRRTMESMFDQLNDSETLARVKALNDRQVNVLWNYGKYFSNELTVKYEIYKSFFNDGEPVAGAPKWAVEEMDDVPNARMEKYLSWVEREIK